MNKDDGFQIKRKDQAMKAVEGMNLGLKDSVPHTPTPGSDPATMHGGGSMNMSSAVSTLNKQTERGPITVGGYEINHKTH